MPTLPTQKHCLKPINHDDDDGSLTRTCAHERGCFKMKNEK